MNKQKVQTLTLLLLTFICTLSLLFTSLAASSGEGSSPEETTPEFSQVLLLGVSPDEKPVPAEDTSENSGNSGNSRVILLGANHSTAEVETFPLLRSAERTAGQWAQGQSLGKFTTTGYCNCSSCSGGFSLTYSGTVPKAKHTISADLDLFPIGTTLMVGGVVYTVEDMGSAVNGYLLDIYYDDHAQAIAHGKKTEEVFAAVK